MSRQTTVEEFPRYTLQFMTEYSVSPEDGDMILPLKSRDRSEFQLLELGSDRRVQKMALLPQPRDLVGAYRLARTGGRFDVQFLPWQSHNIVGMDLTSSPNLFFTAALSGCSVFASGSPQRPTVFHAGISATLSSAIYLETQGPTPTDMQEPKLIHAANSRDAPAFWRILLNRLMPAATDDPNFAETNKHHYSPDGRYAKPIYDAFLATMKAAVAVDGIKIDSASGYGCVFGIQVGGRWKLFRQLNFAIVYSHKRRGRFSTCVPVSVRQWFPKGKEKQELCGEFTGLEAPFTESDIVRR